MDDLDLSDDEDDDGDGGDGDDGDNDDRWFELIHVAASWTNVKNYICKSDSESDVDSSSDADSSALEVIFDVELELDAANSSSDRGQDFISSPPASPRSPTFDVGQEYTFFGDMMVSSLRPLLNHNCSRVLSFRAP